MTDYVIEDNIAIPKKSKGIEPKYIYHKLEVGQSVFIPSSEKSSETMAIYRIVGKKFTRRREIKDGVEGTRIWRVS